MNMFWRKMDAEEPPKDKILIGYDEVTATQFGSPQAGLCLITWVEADEDWPAEWQVQPFFEGLDCVVSETNITHWMPLPPTPST